MNQVNSSQSIKTIKKEFSCDYSGCSRSYTTLGNLKTHLKVHKGELSYICSETECRKLFLTSYALRLHERTHSNERPFGCDYSNCSKRFNTKYRLKSHFRIHTDQLFACVHCNKQFIYRSDLNKHSRIHTGEKPYKCSVDSCSKAFKAGHHLRNHLQTHNNKPFKCSEYLCDKLFKSDSSLSNHLRIEHSFKISKRKNSDDQSETVQIEATFIQNNDHQLDENAPQYEPLINSQIYNQNMVNDPNQLYKFDSSRGLFKVITPTDEINKTDLVPVSTNSLNTQNLNDLLLKLQQNDQLKLDTSSQLTSQFFLNSKELDSLLNNPIEFNHSQTIPLLSDDLAGIELTSLPPSKQFECQELCCLLKFVALDESFS